jgi:hypothetical protein
VGEVAEVRDTVQERTTRARVQQRESVGLTVTKLGEANTVTVAEGVRAALAELRSALPGEVQTFVLQDQSVRVLDALHDVAVALALGVLLTIVVVYMFLHDARGTMIVAVAIPASILATFIPMQLAGFTLNQMTMLGLALSVGILVDDSIVRGTTMARIVQLLREAGAREVHVRIGSPPIKAPCYLGIDMSTRDQLIAAKLEIQQIGKAIGADSLAYLSMDALVEAIGLGPERLCVGCLTGRYPVPVPGERLRDGTPVPVGKGPVPLPFGAHP